MLSAKYMDPSGRKERVPQDDEGSRFRANA